MRRKEQSAGKEMRIAENRDAQAFVIHHSSLNEASLLEVSSVPTGQALAERVNSH
ncbi:MAG: hypothetical protein IKO12_08205 [Bacteroidaceae bacterium]|nr:hypothetical protein [Bacteroidaceae bacterium]